MFATVAIPFEAYQSLPATEFKLLAALSRYSDRAGRAYPSLRQLARDAVLTLSTTWRSMNALHERGCFTRMRRGRGRFAYTLAEAFRPSWPKCVSARVEHGVSQAETQKAYPPKHTEGALPRDRFGKNRERSHGEEVPPAENWGPRLRVWRKSRFWQARWGAKPNEPGCRVPQGLLQSAPH